MRTLLTTLLTLALATSVSAAPKHWYSDWRWWAGEGMMTAAIVGDSITTAQHCVNCVETNPLLGKYPSNKRIAGFTGLNFGIQTGLHLWVWKLAHDPKTFPTGEDPNFFWRGFSYWFQPAAIGVIGGYNINNNIQVNRARNGLQIKKDYLYEMRRKQ